MDLLKNDYLLIKKEGFDYKIKSEEGNLDFTDTMCVLFETIKLHGTRTVDIGYRLKLIPKNPKQISTIKNEYYEIEFPQRLVNKWNILKIYTRIDKIFTQNGVKIAIQAKDFNPSKEKLNLLISKIFLIMWLLVLTIFFFQISKFL